MTPRWPQVIPILLFVVLAACGDDAPATGIRCGIESFTWVGVVRNDGKHNLEVGGHPTEWGGGDRIFPDQNNPTGEPGAELHDRVIARLRLKTVMAKNEGASVFFELLDPDHYSDLKDFDPNGTTSGDDNVAAGGSISKSTGGRLMTADFKTESTEVLFRGDGDTRDVRIGLQLDLLQPGNNWRVRATCKPGGFATSEAGGVVFVPSVLAEDETEETPVLTIWRAVHVEFDVMADPDLTQGPTPSRIEKGSATKINGAELGGTVVGFDSATDKKIQRPERFQGGKITLADNLNNPLVELTVKDSSGDGLDLAGEVPPSTKRFRDLVDDDITNSSPDKVDRSEDMRIDASLWEEKLRPALVLPLIGHPAIRKHSSVIPFRLNVGTATAGVDPGEDTEKELKKLIEIHRGSRSEPGFWVFYILGAFEPNFALSNDPDTAKSIVGMNVRTSEATAVNAGSVVFAEVVRDVAEKSKVSVVNIRRLASIHEVSHQFGLTDEDGHGSLMSNDSSGSALFLSAKTEAEVKNLTFNGAGLRLIMIVRQPGHEK